MAAATKTSVAIVASQSLSVGNTAAGNRSLTTALGAGITARVANGASAPTTGCTVIVYVSTDGSTWREYARATAGIAASTNYDFAFDLAAPWMHARVEFGGHAGNAVTVDAALHELTSIG